METVFLTPMKMAHVIHLKFTGVHRKTHSTLILQRLRMTVHVSSLLRVAQTILLAILTTNANVENNSCDYISCVGCMNISACNFDPVATIGGECIFPDFGYNCSGDCEGDSDGDGICDPFEIPGCSDTTACNFNPDATDNDGSCIYPLNEYDCFGNCVSDQDDDGICDGLESAPELIIPSDISIECDVTYEGNPTASGGCSEPEITYSDINIPGFCPNTFTIVRVYTASDNCGNQTSASQVISVSDTTPPVLTIPADYTAECSDAHPMDDASATDNCGEVTINLVETTIPGACAGDYTITREFTATDECGNAITATQTIAIIDTTAPELTIPADYTAECSDTHPMDDATATDNCGEVTIDVVETTIAGACAGDYSITRVFTATDDCGNATSATQTIIIIDTTAPEFTSIPADYTAECSSAHPMDDASATDNCGEVTIDVVETTIAGACAGDYSITRVFTATDDCGNATSSTQTITIIDTTAPEFTSVPSDYTASCDDDLAFDDASATDNCGIVIITVEEVTAIGSVPGSFTITRTFTATDDCGNATNATQVITVEDITAPVLTIPADYTAECSDAHPMDDASATDNCGEVTIDVVETTTDGACAGDYTITRAFTATDNAGNATSATQTITIIDTTAPELTIPADYTAECSDAHPMDDASATDNCGEATIDVVETTIDGECAGDYTITRAFTATDDCGNATSATQTITIIDTTAPELTIPADYTAECSDAHPMDDASATDNCGEVTIDVVETTTDGACAGDYTITRAFTATDDCGNATSATQTITIIDTTAPELTIPADYTAECSDAHPMDDASATDNCGEVTIDVVETMTDGACAGDDHSYVHCDGRLWKRNFCDTDDYHY